MSLNIDINKMKEVFGDEIEDIINENIDIVEKNIKFLKELKFEDTEGILEMYPELFMNFPKKFEEKILKLKEELGDNFYTIAVVCDKNIRYERLENRVERPFNNEEAQRRDLTEIENIAKAPPIAYADYFLFNNGTTKEYEERLNTILKDIERRMNNEETKR